MAQAHPAIHVKLICGMIARDTECFDAAIGTLTERFGPVDLRSDVIPFDFTDYYRDQMGSGLNRLFVSFDRLVDPACLPDAKLFTNALEDDLARQIRAGVPRPINLDPGYISEAKLVLASAKDFSHRIYLRDGIHAEITLHYQSGDWRPHPWTFPDYQTEPYKAFFRLVRARLREQTGKA